MSPSLHYVNSEPLSQETLNYEYLHGRRYYDAQKYLLPNDEKEQERMDLLHLIWFVNRHASPSYAKEALG